MRRIQNNQVIILTNSNRYLLSKCLYQTLSGGHHILTHSIYDQGGTRTLCIASQVWIESDQTYSRPRNLRPRHYRGPSKTVRTSQHYRIEGSKGAPHWAL